MEKVGRRTMTKETTTARMDKQRLMELSIEILREEGRKVAIDIEFRSGLDSECCTLSSARYITHRGIETVSSLKGSSS